MRRRISVKDVDGTEGTISNLYGRTRTNLSETLPTKETVLMRRGSKTHRTRE